MGMDTVTTMTDAWPPASPSTTPRSTPPVHRVEVRSRSGQFDPGADAVLAQVRHRLGRLAAVHTARIYLIEAHLVSTQLQTVVDELLTDSVTQQAVIGSAPTAKGMATIEVHYRPGVMDPVALSTRQAIAEMLPGLAAEDITVRTGQRYDLVPADGVHLTPDQVRQLAASVLANPVINEVHHTPYHPTAFPHGQAYELRVVSVPIRQLDNEGLKQLSREGHLFLSADEMRAIQAYYQQADREPTDIELETLAQTWSEHCVHKTLKARICYAQPHNDRHPLQTPGPKDWANRAGHRLEPDGSITIENLLKHTIAAATFKLMKQDHFKQWCVSVFQDNAGIVKFDDQDALCIKVETHNHPSAIEPYGGAATGIGGCIRDVMGTGLSARPIANTDVFCVAPPQTDPRHVPRGVIEPGRILDRVVAGVRDYGNRMGIPTVNGAVWFHDDYLGNPLVFAGCVGILPLDKCFGEPRPNDRIIVLGGRTGRDGIHGATFSSAELTDTHADRFSHAVQIGNAITQKKTLDVILQARDHANGPLFTAITDCGAGGFSSAVGEMGQKLGARVTLHTAPLKYQGLSYTEIWISEAQERMVLAVPPAHCDTLRDLCHDENVEFCDLGQFGCTDGDDALLVLTYHDTEVGRLSMHFLHDGLPMPTRKAHWSFSPPQTGRQEQSPARPVAIATEKPANQPLVQSLCHLLAHPNIASKHWIIRQYDHEVQGTSVIKPLVGPGQDGPSDAAVLRPKFDSRRGVAIACGLQPGLGEGPNAGAGDSYWMALAAIDEAVRNCVCVGADPRHIAILDNFCWPNCDDPEQLGRLVRAAEACHDGALAYGTPFVSGKDSLNNQFTSETGRLITIPPTLLVTAMGLVTDITHCVTMHAKAPHHHLLIVGLTTGRMGGSHYHSAGGQRLGDDDIPRVNLALGPQHATAVATLIANRLVVSAHDCSDGGLLVAAAEMAFAGHVGLDLNLDRLPVEAPLDTTSACFAETPSRYLLEIAPDHLAEATRVLNTAGVPFADIGMFANHDRLTVRRTDEDHLLDEPLETLRQAWQAPLDW